jgi:hypothetical protein
MMIEGQPSISSAMRLSSNDLAQAEVSLKNSDPREPEPSEITVFSVNLGRGLADVSLSVPLPENPLGGYLKLELTVVQRGAGLERGRLKVGALIMPSSLIDRTAV